MPFISQGPAVKGSQMWIQKLVDEKPDLLTSLIRTHLNLPDTDTIAWLSPLAADGYAEYRDQAFLELMNIELPNVSPSHFWPSKWGSQR